MFTFVGDVFKTVGLLLQLAMVKTINQLEPYWRAFKRFFLTITLLSLGFFAAGFFMQNTTLFVVSGIMLGASFVLVMLAFSPLVAFIGHFLKESEKAGERFIKTILTIWLWELLTIFYCVVFPVWNDLQMLALVALCALILSLAGVVWGTGYITWFRKALTVLVVIIFIGITISFWFPETAEQIREMMPKIDQEIAKVISAKRATGHLEVADMNYDGFLDSLDIILLKKFFTDPKAFPDSSRGDVNGDGKIDSMDIRYLDNFLFHNGPPIKKKVSYRQPAKKPLRAKSENHNLESTLTKGKSVQVLAKTDSWKLIGRGSGRLVLLTTGQINIGGYIVNADGQSTNPQRPMIPADHTNIIYQRYDCRVPFGAIVFLIEGQCRVVSGKHCSVSVGILVYGSRVTVEGETYTVKAMVSDSYYGNNSLSYNVLLEQQSGGNYKKSSNIAIDTTITLNPHRPYWTSYNIYIPKGSKVTFSASGQFYWDRGACRVMRVSEYSGPEGAPWLANTTKYSQQFILPNERIVCLMAKVGDVVYAIGKGGTFHFKQAGNLHLAINERWNKKSNWDDNSGTIKIRVRIN